MQQFPYQTADEQPTVFTNGSNAVLNTAESAQTDAQHTQPAICAWLKANSMCSKWGAAGAKVCIACEAPRKLQASA